MIKDKLTQNIAEVAKGILATPAQAQRNEAWPDAASTSIYVDRRGTTPITDAESGSDQTMTDEGRGGELKCSSCGSEEVGNYDGEVLCHSCAQEAGLAEQAITENEILEALKKSQPASEWIHDFVNSKDPKFKGKSKAERINMALGAYYAAQRNESVSEGVDEPRAQGEKNFKAAHVVLAATDPDKDDQNGTEAMGDVKPKLPMGTTPTKAENVDGQATDAQNAKAIKASAQSATAPKATGSKQSGAQSAESLKDTTKGGTINAADPKAKGSKQSGAQSADKVSNTAPSGKLSADEPKAKQRGFQPMPKGLKEAAMASLLGQEAVQECMSTFDKQYADDNKKALIQIISGQGHEGIDGKLLPQLNKFIASYGTELRKHLNLPVTDQDDDDKKEVKEAAIRGTMASRLVDSCEEAINRIAGLIDRTRELRDVTITAKIRSALELLLDVAEAIDAPAPNESIQEATKPIDQMSWEDLKSYRVDMYPNKLVVTTNANRNQFAAVLDTYAATQEENIEDVLRNAGFAAVTGVDSGNFKV